MFVLQNVIGWRNYSRRMMVFSTDAGFHYAGDGKVIEIYFDTLKLLCLFKLLFIVII